MNTQWNNKYNASKISLPRSIQNNLMRYICMNKKTIICREENVQSYEIKQMHNIILDIKNSAIDSKIKWYKEITKAIRKEQFYVKGYLTWS